MDENDYKQWDLKNAFTLDEATSLWYNINPYNKESVPSEVKARITTMKHILLEAMMTSKLSLNISPTALYYPISRNNLKAYAERIGQKPLFLFPEERKKQSSLQQGKSIFPCKMGTKWADITITLIANDTVRIKTPEGEERYSYHELGLSDKRKGDAPTILWELLKRFCKEHGRIASKNMEEYNATLPDTAKRLNKHLQKLFGIKESIFKSHYKKEKAYKTKIFFSDQTISARTNSLIKQKEDLEDQEILDPSDNFPSY